MMIMIKMKTEKCMKVEQRKKEKWRRRKMTNGNRRDKHVIPEFSLKV